MVKTGGIYNETHEKVGNEEKTGKNYRGSGDELNLREDDDYLTSDWNATALPRTRMSLAEPAGTMMGW